MRNILYPIKRGGTFHNRVVLKRSKTRGDVFILGTIYKVKLKRGRWYLD